MVKFNILLKFREMANLINVFYYSEKDILPTTSNTR